MIPGKKLIAVLLLLGSHAFAQDISAKLLLLKLQSTDGSTFSFNTLKNNKASVILFLSPDCPLCQNYTLTIKQLQEDFGKANIHFYGIFPGIWYSTEEIKKFSSDYRLNISVLLDRDKVLSRLLKAKVTPEVAVLNASGKVIYQGRIDNWMYTAGKKRTVITKHELKDALEAIANNKAIAIPKTEPVGCLIE